MLTRIDNLSKHGWKLLYMFYLWNVNCKKTKQNKEKTWFLKSSVFIIWMACGECVWVSGGETNLPSWAPSDMEERFKWNEGYCLRYVRVIKKKKKTAIILDGFMNMSLQITVLFVYVSFLFFSWWPLCGFTSPESLYLSSKLKLYVM